MSQTEESDRSKKVDSNADVEKMSTEDSRAASPVNGEAAELAGDSRTDSTVDPTKDPTAEWKAKVLYLTAEIENMRKRFTRERGEVIRMANEELLKCLLPVLDNLELALKALKDFNGAQADAALANKLVQGLVQGVEMTSKHFEQTLEQTGLEPIKSIGTAFDPARHEALGQSESDTVPENHVVNEVQRGFMLHGRVLRPARVIVSKGKVNSSSN